MPSSAAPKRCRSFAIVMATCLVSGCSKAPAGKRQEDALRVAAAADLSFAFHDVGEAFERKTGQKATFTFGSTGALAEQIAAGAPFDVFAAANASFVDEVVKSGACLGETATSYAFGRLAVWGKRGAHVPSVLTDLRRPEIGKIAIADPEHAPYGRAARQALEKSGMWNDLGGKLIVAPDVRQALDLAKSGGADAALVALSLAVVSEGEYTLVDPGLHEPLDQRLVVCGRTDAGFGGRGVLARQFAAFVDSGEGRIIMRRFGFYLPGEPMQLLERAP